MWGKNQDGDLFHEVCHIESASLKQPSMVAQTLCVPLLLVQVVHGLSWRTLTGPWFFTALPWATLSGWSMLFFFFLGWWLAMSLPTLEITGHTQFQVSSYLAPVRLTSSSPAPTRVIFSFPILQSWRKWKLHIVVFFLSFCVRLAFRVTKR